MHIGIEKENLMDLYTVLSDLSTQAASSPFYNKALELITNISSAGFPGA